MQLEQGFGLAIPDKAIEATIGIAGEVSQAGQQCRTLFEALERNHWKDLIDRPGVWG